MVAGRFGERADDSDRFDCSNLEGQEMTRVLQQDDAFAGSLSGQGVVLCYVERSTTSSSTPGEIGPALTPSMIFLR